MSSPPSPDWARVEFGPSLPMPVFAATDPWNVERIGALAMYCSDGRWGDACDEFCHRHLLIPRYDRFAVPGGPGWLVPRETGQDFCQATWRQLEFLVRVHELGRMVLVGHYACAFYSQLLQREPDDCLPAQLADLRTATGALRDWFPEVTVEAFLAMRRGNCLSFHEVQT